MQPLKIGESSYIVLWELQGRKCFYCDGPLARGPYRKHDRQFGWTRDHVKPRANGHKIRKNVVLAHEWCNNQKDDRPPTNEEARAAKQLWERYAKHVGVEP